MINDIFRDWCGIPRSLLFCVALVLPTAALPGPAIDDGDCVLNLSAPVAVADIAAAVKAAGVRDEALDCSIRSLIASGVAAADIAEGLLLAGYRVFDVVRAIVVIGGADVVVDVVARVRTVLGPTVSQTVRDAVAAAARIRDDDSAAELMALMTAGEIASDAGRLQPQDDAGGVPDASLR